MRPLLDQPEREGRFIDVVIIVLPDFSEGLNTDGQFLASHAGLSNGGHLAGIVGRFDAWIN